MSSVERGNDRSRNLLRILYEEISQTRWAEQDKIMKCKFVSISMGTSRKPGCFVVIKVNRIREIVQNSSIRKTLGTKAWKEESAAHHHEQKNYCQQNAMGMPL